MIKCKICNGKCFKETNFTNKCSKCNFLFSNLKPGLGREIKGIKELRKKNFKKIIFILKTKYKKKLLNKNILEIGSGDGYFVEECLKNNLKIYPSEGNKKDFKKLSKRYKRTLFINFEKKIPNKKFDIIVFNDVFEHLNNINKSVLKIKKTLNKNGLVIINLPNSDGIIYKISLILFKLGIKKFYNRLWQKNLSSPHLSYFNSVNLKKLFKLNNFFCILNTRLNTVTNKNFDRINSTIKNSFVSTILSILVGIFYFIQKLFKPDIIVLFFIYNKN